MNTRITRLVLAGVLGLSATLAVSSLSQNEAHAATPESHPDFAWWPTAKPQGTRLFVGNLSLTGEGASAAVQFNPKELTIDKSVPWQ
ncbi:MAG: hypothetical protein ABI577_16790 [bacterium]